MNEILRRAYDHGRATLTAISIAQDCPSLRLEYLEHAAAAVALLMNQIDVAIGAERGELTPRAPGPSIRCNACHDPQTCPQCLALNEMRDARFGKPTGGRNARI